jgi:hypothetical protein
MRGLTPVLPLPRGLHTKVTIDPFRQKLARLDASGVTQVYGLFFDRESGAHFFSMPEIEITTLPLGR